MRRRLGLLALLLAAACGHDPAAAGRPRLGVLVVVDQFRTDYLERFAANFAQDGIVRRVGREGAAFPDCRFRHAFTFTAPGHAVISTGSDPAVNGIVGNSWLDRGTGLQTYCVADPAATIAGAGGRGGVSCRSLRAETLGDALDRATDGAAEVHAVALKDRSAALLAGPRADSALWYDSRAGEWTTSDAWPGGVPEPLRGLRGRIAAGFGGTSWTPLLERERYASRRPDDDPHERPPEAFGRAFPHALPADGPALLGLVALSPAGNEIVLDAARELVLHHGMGRDDTPDLLCVGLSSNDVAGHAFGPDSLEVEDLALRTDRALGAFADFLDREVGRGRWVLAVTSDHGVAPIPEVAQARGEPGVRDPLGRLEDVGRRLEGELRLRLRIEPGEGGPLLAGLDPTQVHLDRRHAELGGGRFAEAQRIVADLLRDYEPVHTVMTREELAAAPAGDEDPVRAALRRSFHPDRSGDVLFVLRPLQIQTSSGTTHGSPWDYDARVPLLLLGAGVRPGTYPGEVSPGAAAATLAKLLGVPAPADCAEPPLDAALLP